MSPNLLTNLSSSWGVKEISGTRIKTDFLEIIEATIEEKLNKLNINWDNSKSLSIVQCSLGYPGKYYDNQEIEKLENIVLEKNEYIFHAGTKIVNNKIFSSGGRVLNFVATSDNFKTCREKVINLIKKINWKKGFYRKDIGYKVIDK